MTVAVTAQARVGASSPSSAHGRRIEPSATTRADTLFVGASGVVMVWGAEQ